MITLKREDYKAIKRMSKPELIAYLMRIFKRGYECGFNEAKKTVAGTKHDESITIHK